MRVDQIITLVWAGNVALLGGTGWVGWKFWQQKQAQREKAAPVEWPAPKQGGEVALQRWPGPVTNFRHVWETPFNGLVPPPPPPPDAPKVEKIDPATAFRNRVQLLTVVEATDPFATMIQVNDTQGGGQKTLVVGQKIDDWQLVRARVDTASSQFRAAFSNPASDKGEVEVVAAMPKVDMPGVPKWKPSYEGPVHEDSVQRDKVEVQAIRAAATGEWMIPVEESDWWAVWGERDVVQKTKFVERPNGLEVASMPPRGPLDNTRGVTQGDVIVSINDRAVKSVADVLAYLRGDGRDLTRYVVVIERDGARRTQVYNVSRRRSPKTTAGG